MELPETELGPFATLYEEWTSSYPAPRDPHIEGRLAAMYREAWKSGQPREQVYVTYFVRDRKDPKDADILIEAVQSPHWDVTRDAVGTLLGWLSPRYAFVQHDDTILRAFRVLALQHPVQDFVRGPKLRLGDGWPEGRTFVQSFERWMCDEAPRDTSIEQALYDSVHDTWTSGDGVDRAFVLSFLDASRRMDANADLIIEGLQSTDIRLARQAAFEAWMAVKNGIDLGPDIREVLEDYRDRFAEFGGYAWHALCDLDPENWPPSLPRSYQDQLLPRDP